VPLIANEATALSEPFDGGFGVFGLTAHSLGGVHEIEVKDSGVFAGVGFHPFGIGEIGLAADESLAALVVQVVEEGADGAGSFRVGGGVSLVHS